MPNQNGVPTLADVLGSANEWASELEARKQRQAQMQQQQQFELEKQQHAADINKQQELEKFQMLKDLVQGTKPGQKFSYKIGDVGISEAEGQPNPMAETRKEALRQNKMSELSKRYEKSNGFLSAIKEIDNLTNKDNAGGVVSNPNAKLQSAGTVRSGVGTSALGLGEMMHMVPKGTTEERKSLERLVLEYQKAMSGARQSDELRKQEREALGFIKSGDPDLVSKGVRSLARNVKRHYETVQAGYTPEVKQSVHESMGNPLDLLGQVYEDQSPQKHKVKTLTPTPQPAPQAAPAPAPQQPPNLNVQAPTAPPAPKTVVKTEVSPSTGKKRITYSDGTQEIQ